MKAVLTQSARNHQVAAARGNRHVPSRSTMTYMACLDIHSPIVNARPRYPGTPRGTPIYPPFSAFSDIGTTSIASHHRPMTHRPSESNWKPPPIDRILCSLDEIYASGVFWRVVSPQLLESQSRLMSAITSMTEKLKTALNLRDFSPPETRPRKYALHVDRKAFRSFWPTDSSPHPHYRKRSTIPSSSDTGVNDAFTLRQSNGFGRDRLSLLNPQPRISSACTIN